MDLSPDDLKHLLETVFTGAIALTLVGGLTLRLTVKPTVDALLKLREAIRSDRDQAQQRIAQLEAELVRLCAREAPLPALDDSTWSKRGVRE
jgi:hypothetical protein